MADRGRAPGAQAPGAQAPIAQHALVDATVARLEAALLSGELLPGQKLSEQELATAFGVSRGPFREAVRTLEGRRLIERTPFFGARLVDVSVDDVEQLMMVREGLEGVACRQAAEMMTLPEVRALRQQVLDSKASIGQEGIGGVYRDGTQDNDFHVQIVRGSRNRWLQSLLCRDIYALLRLFRLQPTSFATRATASVAEHSEIVDAIERRDADKAERLMRLHVANARQNLMAILRSPPNGASAAPGLTKRPRRKQAR